jgi:hypothetical protein
MEDYPRSAEEFERRFATESNCREYLVSLRWPGGFCCPACKGAKAVLVRATLFQCSKCRRQTSATAGTIFQDTRKPLKTWFRAMWYVTSQKNGASALGLQRVLDLKSYETAWAWLHKLRRAMVRPDRDRLGGWIEVDEAMVGGEEEGASGRQTIKKTWVAIAAQVDGPGTGRIRMRAVKDCSAASLHPFIQDCIEPGSMIHTDGWQGYSGLEQKGYRREIAKLSNRKGRLQAHATRSSGRLTAETLASWYTPRLGGILLLALLPGRIHLPVQSPEVEEQGQAILQVDAERGKHATQHLGVNGQIGYAQNTRCWGQLSDAYIHLM